MVDENIHPDKGLFVGAGNGIGWEGDEANEVVVVELVGEKYAKRIEELAIELYTAVWLPSEEVRD